MSKSLVPLVLIGGAAAIALGSKKSSKSKGSVSISPDGIPSNVYFFMKPDDIRKHLDIFVGFDTVEIRGVMVVFRNFETLKPAVAAVARNFPHLKFACFAEELADADGGPGAGVDLRCGGDAGGAIAGTRSHLHDEKVSCWARGASVKQIAKEIDSVARLN